MLIWRYNIFETNLRLVWSEHTTPHRVLNVPSPNPYIHQPRVWQSVAVFPWHEPHRGSAVARELILSRNPWCPYRGEHSTAQIPPILFFSFPFVYFKLYTEYVVINNIWTPFYTVRGPIVETNSLPCGAKSWSVMQPLYSVRSTSRIFSVYYCNTLTVNRGSIGIPKSNWSFGWLALQGDGIVNLTILSTPGAHRAFYIASA